MPPTVSLRAVVLEMDTCDEVRAFLNKQTGELVSVTDEDLGAAEDGEDLEGFPDWQREAIREAGEVLDSDDYLPLPDKYEVNGYAIMERFCSSIEDGRLRDELLREIQGSGAFRRFKNAIHHHSLADDWYRFRDAALEEIAAGWLEANGIPFTRET